MFSIVKFGEKFISAIENSLALDFEELFNKTWFLKLIGQKFE